MCSLFGLIDFNNALTAKKKNKILNTLATVCECRGTDATGIAYNPLYQLTNLISVGPIV